MFADVPITSTIKFIITNKAKQVIDIHKNQ